MALAVKQGVQGNLSPRDGSLLRRHPIEIEHERLAPALFRRGEQVAEDFRGLAGSFSLSVTGKPARRWLQRSSTPQMWRTNPCTVAVPPMSQGSSSSAGLVSRCVFHQALDCSFQASSSSSEMPTLIKISHSESAMLRPADLLTC